MEAKIISYVPANMASFKYILEAAITGNLNVRTDMATPAIIVEIPEGDVFHERMEMGLRNDSVAYTSSVFSAAEDERENIISEITRKCSEMEESRNYYKAEKDKMHEYWLTELRRNERIKKQINAIKVMIDSIFNPI